MYDPPTPQPAIADPATYYAYNDDGQMKTITRPDGRVDAGLPQAITAPDGGRGNPTCECYGAKGTQRADRANLWAATSSESRAGSGSTDVTPPRPLRRDTEGLGCRDWGDGAE